MCTELQACGRVAVGLCSEGLQASPAEEGLALTDGEGEAARGVVLAISREIVDDILQEHPAHVHAHPHVHGHVACACDLWRHVHAHVWAGRGRGHGGRAHALPTLVPAAAPPQLSKAKCTCSCQKEGR